MHRPDDRPAGAGRARSEWDAQQGAILAGFLKILPVFIMVLPGVAAYVLFRDIIGENANQTLPVLITQLIPSGMKGLISAALLAALMRHHRLRPE